MGSAPREHRVKKGKGSFRRQSKHKLVLDSWAIFWDNYNNERYRSNQIV